MKSKSVAFTFYELGSFRFFIVHRFCFFHKMRQELQANCFIGRFGNSTVSGLLRKFFQNPVGLFGFFHHSHVAGFFQKVNVGFFR